MFNAVYGDFRVKGIGNSNVSFINWTDPVLTITGSGDYSITPLYPGSSLSKQIVIQSDAGITLENVNLDVSATDDALAFDITGVSVELTLLGTNILKSGNNKAGLQAPAGSSRTITAIVPVPWKRWADSTARASAAAAAAAPAESSQLKVAQLPPPAAPAERV
jgi:hypothetical protein